MNHKKGRSRITDSLSARIALLCFGLLAAGSCLRAEPPGSGPVYLKVSAVIDGSDRLIITQEGARWEHVDWDWATNVRVNGIPWSPQQSRELKNAGETRFLPPNIDFSTARVVARHGRDMVAMEVEPDKVIVNFDDSPNGRAPYSIDIVFYTKANDAGFD